MRRAIECPNLPTVYKRSRSVSAALELELEMELEAEAEAVQEREAELEARRKQTEFTGIPFKGGEEEGEGAAGAGPRRDMRKFAGEGLSLTSLDVSDNHVRDYGATVFAKVLNSNSTLTMLDLKRNEFGDEGGVALAQTLAGNLMRCES